jgi:phytoene dehydrogenase-like protein
VRTPADLERDFGAPGGLVHGHSRGHSHAGPAPPQASPPPLANDVEAIVRRPANATSIRGLYLAGAGAHPGPGVPMAAISASIVADLIGRA